MKLIFNNKNEEILSYKRGNGREYIVYKNIVRDKLLQYRLAISMHSAGTGLELIEFDYFPTGDSIDGHSQSIKTSTN